MESTVVQTPEIVDESEAAKNIINSILKAVKSFRIYPKSNPVYVGNLDAVCNAFTKYFGFSETLTLRFTRNEIYFESESIYNNSERQDNLALLFFKDGIRVISFHKEITRDEIEDFLNIVSLDFEREVLEDDIVTLFWQRNFSNIDYFAKDVYLSDDDSFEALSINDLKSSTNEISDLQKAYEEIIDDSEPAPEVTIVPVTEEDISRIQEIIRRDRDDKLPKFFDMLLEIFLDSERAVEYEDMAQIFMKSIEFAVRYKRFHLLTEVISSFKKIITDKSTDNDVRQNAIRIVLFVSSKKIISIIGELLENGEQFRREEFDQFIDALDKNAIPPFMNLLAELENMHARKAVINILSILGPKDMGTLLKGLNHSRWYVVRNIVYVLRQIGDRSVISNIVKTLKHRDERVRREAIRALGELGRDNVLKYIEESLDDPDIKVRKAALVAMGNISTEAAKTKLIERIERSSFVDLDIVEKRGYFVSLARWKDDSVFKFIEQMISKKSFWKKSRYAETRACAAYSLGILADKRGIPILRECLNSKDSIMRKYATEAIRRIENAE